MFGRKLISALAAFAALTLMCVFLVNRISAAQRTEEIRLVREAVKNAALTCYAVEGAYPLSVEYLRDHYGLAFDGEKYIVVYDAFASNLMPEIRVLERGVAQP